MSNEMPRQLGPSGTLNQYLTKHKNQLEAALPKHLSADRMARIALTCFSQNAALQKCTPESIFASVVVASQLGLEPGIYGQGYLVPYKNVCTFIPGWQGYVDLVSRSGRASVRTGAVFKGDDFDYALGTDQYIRHRPGDNSDANDLEYVYAIGEVVGSPAKVIEVWSRKKIESHRDKYNKVGKSHYSFTNFEMYARKVPLLQVIKYLPKSVQLTAAQNVDLNATEGRHTQFIDGDFVTVDDGPHPSDASDIAVAIAKQSEQAKAQPAEEAGFSL